LGIEFKGIRLATQGGEAKREDSRWISAKQDSKEPYVNQSTSYEKKRIRVKSRERE